MREDTRRDRAFRWVMYNLPGYDDGRMMRWYEILIRYLFMPFNTFWYYLDKHNSPFDDYGEVITLYGIKYRMVIFRGLGIGLPLNTLIRIIKREDGMLTLETVEEGKNGAQETKE